MPANLTIYIGTVNSSGVRVPLVGAKVYLRPSRTDITYLNGVNYLPWDVNQTSDPGYRDCWVATTNGAGYATCTSGVVIPTRLAGRWRAKATCSLGCFTATAS